MSIMFQQKIFKTVKYSLFFMILYLFQGCADTVREKTAEPEFLKSIKRVRIYNKTQNTFIADSIEIVDTIKISKIVEELKKMKDFSLENKRANFGFFQLDISYSNERIYEILVTYSKYQGVVISDMDGKEYKNDALESLILYYFQAPSLKQN